MPITFHISYLCTTLVIHINVVPCVVDHWYTPSHEYEWLIQGHSRSLIGHNWKMYPNLSILIKVTYAAIWARKCCINIQIYANIYAKMQPYYELCRLHVNLLSGPFCHVKAYVPWQFFPPFAHPYPGQSGAGLLIALSYPASRCSSRAAAASRSSSATATKPGTMHRNRKA